MSANMRNLSLGNGSLKTYNLRHLPWAVRPPASSPTLFLAYTLDFSKGAFANLFIQGCFSNICQSIYINIDVKRDNLCISISMSNLSIYIYRSGLFAQVGEREDVLEFLQNVENATRFLFCYYIHQHHHPSDVHSIFVTLLILISSLFTRLPRILVKSTFFER